MVPVLLFVSGLDHRAAHPRNGTVSARAKMLPENPQPGIVGRRCTSAPDRTAAGYAGAPRARRCGRGSCLRGRGSHPRGGGMMDLLWTPAEPNAPAANFARVADLPDSVVFRFTVCEW